jgi:coenzyme F420-reducing hydrogenase beta subunit
VVRSLEFTHETLVSYSGFYNKPEVLKSCASGGVATRLSEWMIQEGGTVFGVAYSSDFKRAGYCSAKSVADIEKLKGSKYIYADKQMESGCSVYQAVADLLKRDEKVLFVGLGCDVFAVKTYLFNHNISTAHLYLVDLVCDGPTEPIVQDQYIELLEKKYKSKIKYFSVRYKKYGWTPPYVRAEFESGKIFEKPFYETDFGYAFNIFKRISCYKCQFKGERHYSDLTIGDYWGLTRNMSGYNKDGVSIIFLHSEKGKALINNISTNDFTIENASTEIALLNNIPYTTCRDKPDNYNKFKWMLDNKGLHYAVIHDIGKLKYYMKVIYREIRNQFYQLWIFIQG